MCLQQEFEVFQIEISKAYGKFEWHEDIKRVLKMAGEANQKVQISGAYDAYEVTHVCRGYKVMIMAREANLKEWMGGANDAPALNRFKPCKDELRCYNLAVW